MKIYLLLFFILSLVFRAVIYAQVVEVINQPGLLLIEVQTGTSLSASAEFVEFANLSFEPLNLESIELQYMPASASGWQTKAELSGFMQPYGRLLATTEVAELDGVVMSSGLAAGGGHVRLYDSANDIELDRLGWGTSLEPLIAPALEPQKDESLKRLNNEDGYFQNIGDNSLDWFISLEPSPHSDGPYLPEIPENNSKTGGNASENKSTGQSSGSGQAVSNASYPKIVINEVLPDPESPQTDANDEFVELFNPNATNVDLAGYILKTGGNLRNSQVLDSLSIKAKSYVVVKSSDTNISLSNSGGVVQLLDGNLKVVSQVEYPSAETGMSWSLGSQQWGWANPTPNNPNSQPATESDGQSVLGSNTASRGNTTIAADSAATRNIFEPPPESEIAPIDYTILASVGSLAIMYVVYEYRHDIGNRIAQFKRYLEARRQNRRQLKGGRNNRADKRYWWRQNSLRTWLSRGRQ